MDQLEDISEEELKSFALILLDRQINGGDAWMWAENLEHPRPRIILMSGLADAELTVKYERILHAASVSKDPFEDFYERLKKSFRRSIVTKKFFGMYEQNSQKYTRMYMETK